MAKPVYIRRSLEPVLRKAAGQFPAVVLTGPRQSGKTTLLRHLFGRTHRYVSLELPDVRGAALSDPRGFLELHPAPVIFDEVQCAPELLAYVKERIDAERSKAGRYLLTGSQNLLLTEGVNESLAGRAAMLRLSPLSWRERTDAPGAKLPWEKPRGKRVPIALAELWDGFLRGGYPELRADPGKDAALWHGSYIQTYLERDVRLLRQVGDLTQFQNFLRALAARSAQLLNMSDLARDLGVSVPTVKAWISVLEATYQIYVLRPYHANVSKRLVKMPKVYFSDVGTLCYLTGLKDPAHAASGPLGGAIFETAVLSELVRTISSRGEDPQLYFWRTATGVEVDFLVETQGTLIPIEVKLSATPRPAMAKAIEAVRADLGEKVAKGYLVHPGEVKLPLGPQATAVPFAEL